MLNFAHRQSTPSNQFQKWKQYFIATTHIHICSWGKTSTRRPLFNSCHSWVHSCIVCNSWWLGNWYYFIHLICNIKVFSKINIICPETENLSIARSKEEIYFSKKCKEKFFFFFWHFNKAMLEHHKSCKPSTFYCCYITCML